MSAGDSPRCESGGQIEVCIPVERARPGTDLQVTVVNGRSTAVVLDLCAMRARMGESPSDEFVGPFDPTLRCGRGASDEDVLLRAVTIPPGSSHVESMGLSPILPQGWYRVNVYLLQEDTAVPTSDSPFLGPVFDVYRFGE